MTKLTKAGKANKYGKEIEAYFVTAKNAESANLVNDVCTLFIQNNMDMLQGKHDIQLLELDSIVKAVGLEKGFLVKTAERKANCIEQIKEEITRGFHDREDFENYCLELSEQFDLAETWVNNTIHEIYKKEGRAGLIPPKDHLKDWQRFIFDRFMENPDVAEGTMHEEIEKEFPELKSGKQYVSIVLPILHEIRDNYRMSEEE